MIADRGLSDSFFEYKTLAIICVAAAHCSYEDAVINRISGVWGTIGVPIFLAISGYFTKFDEPAQKFWNKKLRNIIIPWLLYGLITYLIGVVLGTTFSVYGLIKWIVGNYTWLYFVPVLLTCFVIYRISQHGLYMLATMIIFLLSNILTTLKLIDYPTWLTSYQLVFNWCGFFAVGILLKQKDFIFRYSKTKIIYKLLILMLFCVFGIVYICSVSPSYWSVFALPYEFVSIVALFGLACILQSHKLLVDIGKKTYVIYFLHMQLGIGTFNYLARKLNIIQYELLILIIKPIVIVLLVYLGVKIVEKVGQKTHWDKFLWIFGFK